jgi:hypothetical protein
VGASFQDGITPFAGETPRREAVRTLGAAGAAFLGVAGLASETQAKGKNGRVAAEHRRRRRRCKCKPIGFASALSEPFSLQADTGVTMKASCPEGFFPISGGLEGATEVTANCQIRESYASADGSGWNINVFCAEASNTTLRVGVICFAESRFRDEGQPD